MSAWVAGGVQRGAGAAVTEGDLPGVSVVVRNSQVANLFTTRMRQCVGLRLGRAPVSRQVGVCVPTQATGLPRNGLAPEPGTVLDAGLKRRAAGRRFRVGAGW